MKKITLTQGHFTLVDDSDFETLNKYGWCILKKKNGRLYAMANIKINGRWRRVLMHRFILKPPRQKHVDHIDNNGLNNQRHNLRLASINQTQYNSGRRSYKGKRSSKYKGVHWHPQCKKWVAQIMADRKYYYLGVFNKEKDAAKAYDKKAKELHGEFAKTNFNK